MLFAMKMIPALIGSTSRRAGIPDDPAPDYWGLAIDSGSAINFGDLIYNRSGLLMDPSGDYFAAFQKELGTADRASITTKISAAGAVVWARDFSDTSYNKIPAQILRDSSGNIYTISSNNLPSIILCKYNSSGTLQYQKRYTGGTAELAADAVFLTDGSIVIACNDATASPYKMRVIKVAASTGATTWAKTLVASPDTANNRLYSIKATPDGGFVLLGTTATYGSGGATNKDDLFLTKMDTDGAFSWQRALGTSNVTDVGSTSRPDLFVTDSGVIYSIFSDASSNLIILKHESGGVNTWRRSVSGYSISYAIFAHDTWGVVIAGVVTGSTQTGITRLTASGVVRYSAKLTYNDAYFLVFRMICDQYGTLSLLGRSTSGDKILLVRVPIDLPDVTGMFDVVDWVGPAAAAMTLTLTTPTFTTGTFTPTETSTSYAESANSLTTTLTDMG